MAGQLVYQADGGGGMVIIEVDPDGFNTTANLIQSLAIADSANPIARARLACTGTDTVHWDLSVDDGLNWQEFVADATRKRMGRGNYGGSEQPPQPIIDAPWQLLRLHSLLPPPRSKYCTSR